MNSLICITTCNRSLAIKAIISNYIKYCTSQEKFDLVVSIDGRCQKTSDFLSHHRIPHVQSVTREGVGISKNRVLEAYPEYDYYFFIEDDVFLIDPSVFQLHIEISGILKIHHMSLFPRERLGEIITEADSTLGKVLFSNQGSAQFNFFTAEGLKKVGGFHTEFSKYCRFGHTEHSFRYKNNGISPAPFAVLERAFDGFLKWSDPVSATKISVNSTEDRLFVGEQELINQKLLFFPLTTLSKYSVKSYSNPLKKINFIRNYTNKIKYKLYLLTLDVYRKIKRCI